MLPMPPHIAALVCAVCIEPLAKGQNALRSSSSLQEPSLRSHAERQGTTSEFLRTCVLQGMADMLCSPASSPGASEAAVPAIMARLRGGDPCPPRKPPG